MSTDDLYTKVLVRRVGVGATPFTWEVIGANAGTPLYVSPDRFRSMEEAYSAGQKRLVEFLPSNRVKRKNPLVWQASTSEIMANDKWQSDADDADETDADVDLDADDWADTEPRTVSPARSGWTSGTPKPDHARGSSGIGGRFCHPAMVRVQSRALALSVMPGNSRRNSIAADNSPSRS